MLTIYRRHIKTCAHRSEGRKYRRCRCPIWADGFIGREEIRRTLSTRDWEKAQGIIREWEAKGEQATDPEPVTVAQAWQDFLADAQARNLREPTIYKYELLSRQMEHFAQGCGLRFISELDLPMLRKFRASWPNQNLGALKKLEYLRAFFRFAHDAKWIEENPARKLESPKVKQRPTMPFTRTRWRLFSARAKSTQGNAGVGSTALPRTSGAFGRLCSCSVRADFVSVMP